MSNQLTVMQDNIFDCENRFNAVNAYKLNFKREASFALQLLGNNSFLLGIASENPASLENAISNLAAIGISLNPATKEAYLVPRSRAVCLDISAIGLMKLATDSGSISWAQSKIVFQKDTFEDNGSGQAPTHKFEAFGERGAIVGVYAVAKTSTGDYLTDTMSIKECHDIRDRSEAWKSFKAGKTKSCPWSTDEGEMMKKTVIKRASKLWPKSERLDTAVDVLNQHEGIDFNHSKTPHMDAPVNNEAPSDATFSNIRALLKAKNKTEESLLLYLATQSGVEKIERLEDINAQQTDYAYRALGGKK